MENLIQTIKSFWVGLTLSGSNLAKAMEYTEYGSYIAIMILLLSIIGLIAYSRKNYITSDAAGTAALFAILPAWFVMREIGLLSFIVIILIVNLVMNKVTPGQKYRNFQFATLVSGFIISLASVFVAFMKFNSTSSYSNDPAASTSYFSELDPIRNGVYSLAPLFIFLMSLMIGRSRKRKELTSYDGAFDDYNENWATPMSNAAALASAEAATAVGNFDQQRADSRLDVTGRLRSLEELFNEGADEEDIYAEIFGKKKEQAEPIVQSIEKTESMEAVEKAEEIVPEVSLDEVVPEVPTENEVSTDNIEVKAEEISLGENVETIEASLPEEPEEKIEEPQEQPIAQESTIRPFEIKEKKFDLFNDTSLGKKEKLIDFFGDSSDEVSEPMEQIAEAPIEEIQAEEIAAVLPDEMIEPENTTEIENRDNIIEETASEMTEEIVAEQQEPAGESLFDKLDAFQSEDGLDDEDEYEEIHVDYSSVISETSKFAQIQRENAERRRQEEEAKRLAEEQERILAEQQAQEIFEPADEMLPSLEDVSESPAAEIQSSSDEELLVAEENLEFSTLSDEIEENSLTEESAEEIIAEELVEIAQEEQAIAQEISEENEQAALEDGEVFAHTIAANASVAMDAVKSVHFTQSFSFERNNITDFQSHYFNKLTKMGANAVENKEEIEEEKPVASEEQPLFLDEVPTADILIDEETIAVDEELIAQVSKQADEVTEDVSVSEALENVADFNADTEEISVANAELAQTKVFTQEIEEPMTAVVDFEQVGEAPQEMLIEAVVEPEVVIESSVEDIIKPVDEVEISEPIIIAEEEISPEIAKDTLSNVTEVTQDELEAIIEEVVQEVATEQPIHERPAAIEDIMRAVNRAIGELKLAEEQKASEEAASAIASAQENLGDIKEVAQENAEIVLETAPVEFAVAEIAADEIGGEVDEMNIALMNKEAVEENQVPKEEKVPVRINIDGLGETEAFVDSESDSIVVNIKLSNDKSKYIVDNVVVEKKSAEEPQEPISEMPKEVVQETPKEFVAETPTYRPVAVPVSEPAPQPTVMTAPVTPFVTPMVAKADLSIAPEITKSETTVVETPVMEEPLASNVVPMDTPMTAEELEQTREFVIAPEILAAMEAMAEKEKSQEIVEETQSEETIFSHWLDLLNEDDENEIADSMTNDEEPQAIIEDSLVAQAAEELPQEPAAQVAPVEVSAPEMTVVEMQEPVAEIQAIEIPEPATTSVEMEESVAQVQPIEITSEMEEPAAEVVEEMPEPVVEEPMIEEIQEPVIEASESEQAMENEFAELENQISIDNYIAEGVEVESAPINEFDPAAEMIELEEEFLNASGESAEQASVEMDIFCNQQEEYHKSQYYFLKTQIDFYKKQMGYYQKQLSVTEGQLDFYTQQADMYLKQAEFYKVQRDDEKEQ